MNVFATYALGLLIIIIYGIYYYFKRSVSYWKRKGVTSIPCESIFGSFKDSTTQKITLAEDIDKWYKIYKAQGLKYFGAYFFHLPSLCLIDPGMVRNVLSKDFHHFVDRGMVVDEENDPLTGHLFSLSGQKWKQLRQKLTPVFTSGKLKSMFDTLVACAKDLSNCLDDFVEIGEDVDIKQILVKYTTDVIGSCAFGLDCNSFVDPDSEFLKVGQLAFRMSKIDHVKIIFLTIFPKLSKFFRLTITPPRVDRFFRNLVADTIHYREENNIQRNDFMQLLMKLKTDGIVEGETDETTLTVDQIAAQAFIFFIAGFETSSSTMQFVLYELSENLHIQEKLHKEILQVLDKYEGHITYDAIMEMKLLDRVVKEALRKHAPVGLLQRIVTTESYRIPETDIVLSNKQAIFIPVQSLHNDPEYYPNPEVFDPERFTDEAEASRPDFTYLPFGDGPRICIGLRFGLMQTKVGLCRLLASYKFHPSPRTSRPLILDPKVFIRTVKDGVWLKVTKI